MQCYNYKKFMSQIICPVSFILKSCIRKQRGTCIKGLKWPPLEQKNEMCFSQVSLDAFITRMAAV